MNIYLISYDLGLPETYSDYRILREHIKTYPNWAKPLQSVWLIKTNRSVSEVRDAIKNLIDSNDKVLVIEVAKSNWASYNLSKEVADWMKENL